MKSFLKILLSFLLILGTVNSVSAFSMMDDLVVGDLLMLTDYNQTNIGYGWGGEYDLTAKQAVGDLTFGFQSWCAEKDETIGLNEYYGITGFSAMNGGAAWLLEKYFGDASYRESNLDTETKQGFFQVALWFFRGQVDLDSDEQDNNTFISAYNKSGAWDPTGKVFVAELGSKQDMYVYRTPVSEPATMFLLGTSLLGLVAFRRRGVFKE